jgi:hypothetical protein
MTTKGAMMSLRQISIVLCFCILMMNCSGCTTLLVNQSRFMGIGSFSTTHTQITPTAQASEAQGFGLYLRGSTVGFGWIDRSAVILDQNERGIHVCISEHEIITGDVAEHVASGACGPSCQHWVPISSSLRVIHHTLLWESGIPSESCVHKGVMK